VTYPYGGDPQQNYQGYQPAPGYPPAQPPVPYGYGPPPMAYGPVATRPQRSAGVAVALEIVLGIFGIFGVGNLYAGRVGPGIALMVGFWALFWINFLLSFIVIGWFTYPLTWIAFLIVGPICAARGVERYNQR
jgi:TM2 domain-containing membrane protein YozV